MFKKILIANRGEIALRIIRCCREMNIKSLVVYSMEDKNSLPVMLSPESVCIGPAKAKDSYLNQDTLIETAIKTGCDAIHPGYGFLSENADFARKCEERGIVFIGPSSALISQMGDKQTARSIMKKHGVPVVPGSDGCIETAEEAMDWAEKVGYPVLIKATAGGGGKGMRRVFKPEDIKKNFDSAKAEAEAAFGNGDLYLEKLILDPRHIEVQIIADKHGNVVELGERDCSLQRANQKLLEESPAVFIDEKVRSAIRSAAVKAAKAVKYFSAGTVEFVLDKSGKFYFIEMNTRIQVEHPVTECATGVDLIKEQILVALDRKLSFKQRDISIKTHVIECRINALSTGKIKTLHFPGGLGVRVESALFEGCEISPFYDPMIAKVIVFADNRREAVRRLRRCLEEIIIDGIDTNTHLMYLLTYQPEFIRGGYDTSYWKNVEEILVSELTEVNKYQ